MPDKIIPLNLMDLMDARDRGNPIVSVEALEPLAFDLDAHTFAVHGRVHEELILNAVLLQVRRRDTTAFTPFRRLGVLGGHNHIVLVLLAIQHVPAAQPKDVEHDASLSKVGFQCVRSEYQRAGL